MYTVYPLEGQWGLQEKYLHEPVMKKEHFSYQLMIRQPDFVTEAISTRSHSAFSEQTSGRLERTSSIRKDGRRSLCPNLTHWFL